MSLTDRMFSPRVTVRFAAVVLAVVVAFPLATRAQSLGTVKGTVVSAAGDSIGGATVALNGAQRKSTTSGAGGAFAFEGVAPGVYTIVVAHGGFQTARLDVVVAGAADLSITVRIQAQSFESLRTIGTVSSTGSSPLNASTAAITTVDRQAFLDRGSTQVVPVLDEVPGVNFQANAPAFQGVAYYNGAFEGGVLAPSIRGALPYETQTLIDGHPVAVGESGTFAPTLLDPHVFQSIEIAKGPGVAVPDINYAIGGSVNYITLNPTARPVLEAEYGIDGYGGKASNFRATGSALSGKLGYALDYAIGGTPGPFIADRPVNFPGTFFAGNNAILNGRVVCGGGQPTTSCGSTHVNMAPPYVQNAAYFSQGSSFVVCCLAQSLQYNSRSYLAKLRYAFSPATSFTASYVGDAGAETFQGFNANINPYNSFTPLPGYGGPEPQGSITGVVLGDVYQHQGLFSLEARTSSVNDSLLARYYVGMTQTADMSYPGFGVPTILTGVGYGSVALGTNTTQTFFNGVPVTVNEGYRGGQLYYDDYYRGLSFEYDRTLGTDGITLSFDKSYHNAVDGSIYDPQGPNASRSGYSLLPGSGETLQTFMLRGSFQIGARVQGVVANYFENYTTHSTPDRGASFVDATNSFYGPRVGFTWQPSRDTSMRLAAGSSIAPPYTSLLATSNVAPNITGVIGNGGYYTETIATTLKPETAFGYDLGVDQRFGRDLYVSADAYLTNLKGQYLTATTLMGTYTSSFGTAPLFATQTVNLGDSRYEGLELSVRDVPRVGFGFVLNADLLRAYPYALPHGFYDTAAGTQTTNLAVIPNVNFQPSYFGYNGFRYGRIPYSTGYAELNFTARNNARASIGLLYQGSNNPLNEPAYGELNANIRVPVAKAAYVQISGENLTGAYDSVLENYVGGVPAPLVNGKLGYTNGGTLGPATYRLILHIDTGR